MGKVHPEISDKLKAWVERQKVFFVATAPLAREGHINCSPKGMDSFRILDPLRVAYLDLTGSGVETIAHLKENGRIVIMFCGFEGPPQIIRFHGKGRVYERGTKAYDQLISHFEGIPGSRSIIDIQVERVSDSCGYAVPLYEYQEDRDVLTRWSEQKGEAGIQAYHRDRNARSLDGLPGIDQP